MTSPVETFMSCVAAAAGDTEKDFHAHGILCRRPSRRVNTDLLMVVAVWSAIVEQDRDRARHRPPRLGSPFDRLIPAALRKRPRSGPAERRALHRRPRRVLWGR